MLKRLLNHRVVTLVTVAVLVTGATPPPNLAPYNAFGVSALQKLAAQSKNENVFISPLSIGVALAMAADGAKGATRAAILRTLNLNGSSTGALNATLFSALESNHDAAIGIADALWTRRDIRPNPQFAAVLQREYRARARALDFGEPSAAAAINAWTKAHTLGLIDRIVDRTSPNDFLYLTNALAFKATWTLQFNKRDTAPMPFTNADGTKSTVQMMSHEGNYAVYDAPAFSALRMPYGAGGFAAYILLPHADDVDALVQSMSAAGIDTIARQAQQSDVAVSVPRFTARYSASLVPLLRSMGMGIAFSGRADFSGIHAAPPRLAITSVNHAAYVRVDEQGTTAAAATSAGISMLAIRRPQRTFIVDRPFVLVLRDERTGALLFAGAIRELKQV